MGMLRDSATFLLLGTLAAVPSTATAQSTRDARTPEPQRQTIVSGGEEREYFVRLPAAFDSGRQYWLMIVVHGAGGSGKDANLGRYWSPIQEAGINAILVTPSFKNDMTTWFPSLGEGDVLIQMIDRLRTTYPLFPKILIAGFSGGANFVHRFTFEHASMVSAAVAYAAGSWTTPDGRFLVKGLGEVRDARTFANGQPIPTSMLPGREHYLNEVAVTTGIRRLPPGTPPVPFLVMCGTRDVERIDNAKAFARSLSDHGFPLETDWPDASHELTPDVIQRTIKFFQRVTGVSLK
jgi:poly(3-hydroxybutyrate) depolymerase